MSIGLKERIDELQRQLDLLKQEVAEPIRTVKVGDLEWQVDCPDPMSWEDAKKYALSLGEGWRLPTVQELVSLWDYDKGCCAAFPEANSWYWSSSPYGDGLAWFVSFDNGYVSSTNRGAQYGVRCVR